MKFLQELYRRIVKWVQNLNRVEKATILTLLSLCFILSLLAILHLQNNISENFIEITPINEEFVDIEQVKEQERQKEWEDFLNNARATTQSYNEADRKLRHTDDNFKTLDELIQEREMQQSSENLLTNSQGGELKVPDEKLETLEENTKKATDKLKKDNTVNKNSYVRYSLADRKPLRPLPNPIYTCGASGKIVINITVNSEGNITELAFNPNASTSSNGCLVENALSYARQARFNANPQKEKQIGTITYYFQGR